MKQYWKVRSYKEGDEEHIFKLRKKVYPKRDAHYDRWIRLWQWMYKQNPAREGRIKIATHDGEIIGQSAAIPVRMKIGDEIVIGFQFVDALTHPEHRGRGIWVNLSNILFAELESEDINIGYAFPSEMSYPIEIGKLDWHDLATSQMMWKPLNWENALKIKINSRILLKLFALIGNLVTKILYPAIKAPTIKGLTISQVTSFDERINKFWEMISNRYPIMIVRNKDYLNWRYNNVPDLNYTSFIAEKDQDICGYLILQCIPKQQIKTAAIFDILGQSEDIEHCLVSKAVEYCKQEKVDLIYISLLADRMLQRAIKKSGFISVPFIKGRRVVTRSSLSSIPKGFITDPKNWFIQIGDSDTT